jgi:hypothetical protein
MLRIHYLDLHHFHFVPAPEFLLSGPPVACGPSSFLKRVEQGEKISPLPLGIESRSERIFESVRQTILILDPENHRRLQRIEIEKPSLDLHGSTQLLISSE